MSRIRGMIPNVSISHGKAFRANGKLSPVRQNYSGNIRVAICGFCEAGGTFPLAGHVATCISLMKYGINLGQRVSRKNQIRVTVLLLLYMIQHATNRQTPSPFLKHLIS
jgi:hypothetical protein